VRGMDISERVAPSRAVGVAGLVAVVLVFTGVNLQDIGGGAEPSFTAPAAEVTGYLTSRDPAVWPFAAYLTVLGISGLLWFGAGLATVLRRALPDFDWMPSVVLVSGATAAGILLVGTWETAIRAGAEGVTWFRSGGLGLANAWLPLGSLALATGLAILRHCLAPSWLGWWAMAGGIGLVAARAVWTTGWWWFVPYVIFWVWVITVCIRMVLGRRL
jgi:hypothetical protein